MGYYADILETSYRIKKDKLEAAFTMLLTHSDFTYEAGEDDIFKVFEEQSFMIHETEEGDLIINGIDGKWREQESFLTALAPYSEGFIGFQGEDNELWGYEFKDGEIIHKSASVVWV